MLFALLLAGASAAVAATGDPIMDECERQLNTPKGTVTTSSGGTVRGSQGNEWTFGSLLTKECRKLILGDQRDGGPDGGEDDESK